MLTCEAARALPPVSQHGALLAACLMTLVSVAVTCVAWQTVCAHWQRCLVVSKDVGALRERARACRAGSREAHAPQARDWRGGLCGEQAVELLRDFYAAGNPKGARPRIARACRLCPLVFSLCTCTRQTCSITPLHAAIGGQLEWLRGLALHVPDMRACRLRSAEAAPTCAGATAAVIIVDRPTEWQALTLGV